MYSYRKVIDPLAGHFDPSKYFEICDKYMDVIATVYNEQEAAALVSHLNR
jgi:hypothetical protein